MPAFGEYEVVRPLGAGGMGAVHEVVGRDGRRWALKTLHSLDAVAALRFRREVEALARLEHPHILRLEAADVGATPPYVVTELLTGGTLQERLAAGPLAPGEVAAVGRKLAGALAHAHARGILHRDVKPANVLFDERGEPRLADFGLARHEALGRLTTTGELLGTPAFMAPEQALGLPVDARTDVYGLGVTLDAALRGRPPFTGVNAVGVLQAVVAGAAPRLDGAPPALAAVVRRAMAREPADRFPSADALADALTTLSLPTPRRRARAALLALAVALALALVALMATLRAPRGAGPPPAGRAPTLDLAGLPDPVFGPRLVVAGRVQADAAWVDVSVGPVHTRIAAGGPFALELPLEAHERRRRLEVVAVDAAGRRAVGAVEVQVRPDLPAWLGDLPPAERPPRLPVGCAWRGEARQVEHARTGMRLVWVAPEGAQPGFYAGRFELTWDELRRAGLDPGVPPYVEPRPRHPVHSLRPGQAEELARALGLRLPTSAEWDRLARGPERRPLPWGAEPPWSAELARMGRPDRETQTAEVGSHPRDLSVWGCYDVLGNVAELVAGGRDGAPTAARGGAWAGQVRDLSASRRPPTDHDHTVGLRLVVEP